MKRAYLHRIVSTIAVMAVFVTPLYGQRQNTGSFVYQNFTLSDFGDGYDAAKNLVWKPRFSEYAVQVQNGQDEQLLQEGDADAPVVMGANADPARNAVRYSQSKPDGISEIVAGSQKFVLGVKAAFTKQGYNWIELYPNVPASQDDNAGNQDPAAPADPAAGTDPAAPAVAADNNAGTDNEDDQFRVVDNQINLLKTTGEVDTRPDLTTETVPYRIPFAGTATELTMWVWGGQYGWTVESYLRDYAGNQYRIPMGDLLYTGWMQKRAAIPNSVIQGRKRLPATQSLQFEMIKLWSFPSERVDSIYVYFDLLQHNGVISTEDFNGKDLETLQW